MGRCRDEDLACKVSALSRNEVSEASDADRRKPHLFAADELVLEMYGGGTGLGKQFRELHHRRKASVSAAVDGQNAVQGR